MSWIGRSHRTCLQRVLVTLVAAAMTCTGCTGSDKPSPGDGAAADGSPSDVIADTARTDAPTDGETNDGPVSDTAAAETLASDAAATDSATDGATGTDASDGGLTAAVLCTSTGGTPKTSSCCAATSDFPNTCNVGACGCAPASSVFVSTCACPTGTCFTRERGCAVPVCMPGADQSCNDNPAVSSLHGKCLADSTCMCVSGFAKNPGTGRCL